MDRLTHKLKNEAGYKANRGVLIWECVDKLGQLEDLEEKGQLIDLPCAVGDMVYTNTSMQGWNFRKKNMPYAAKVVFIGINGVDNHMNVDFGNGHMLQFNFSDIGKTVFLTQEQAEQALKEMGRNRDWS